MCGKHDHSARPRPRRLYSPTAPVLLNKACQVWLPDFADQLELLLCMFARHCDPPICASVADWAAVTHKPAAEFWMLIGCLISLGFTEAKLSPAGLTVSVTPSGMLEAAAAEEHFAKIVSDLQKSAASQP